MENKKMQLCLQIGDIFNSIESINNNFYSLPTKHLQCQTLHAKVKECILETDYFINMSKQQLITGLPDPCCYAVLGDDKRWEIPLCLTNKDGAIDEELRIINEMLYELREKMVVLGENTSFPSAALCKDHYKVIRKSGMFQDVQVTAVKGFIHWKRSHLQYGTEAEKKNRLEDLLEEHVIAFLLTDVLDDVEQIKSRAELAKGKNDYDFSEHGSDCAELDKKYGLFSELFDSSRTSKGKLILHIPNDERIGRFLHLHCAELGDSGVRQLLLMICQIDMIQEEMYPKEKKAEPNRFAVSKWLKELYLPACAPWLQEGYDKQWLEEYADAMMEGEQADEWAVEWVTKKYKLIGKVIASLMVTGVLKDKPAQLAEAILRADNRCDIEGRSFAKYISDGRSSNLAEWAKGYQAEVVKG